MLHVIFGDCPEAIYNTAVFFKNTYKPQWITSPLSVEIDIAGTVVRWCEDADIDSQRQRSYLQRIYVRR